MQKPEAVPNTRLKRELYRIGSEYYGTLPWHRTNDPYKLFVAEYFLRRTTRTVVSRIQQSVVRLYPTLEDLAKADPEQLVELARDAGLYERTRQLVATARDISADGGFRPNRDFLLQQTAVGPYIADAVLLYAYGKKTFPLDSSVQRVLYRTVLGKDAKKDSKPYKDIPLVEVAMALTSRANAEKTKMLHQGILAVAWVACRQRPVCQACPVSSLCRYPHKTGGTAL